MQAEFWQTAGARRPIGRRRTLAAVIDRLAGLEEEYRAVEARLADPEVLADPARLRDRVEALQGADAARRRPTAATRAALGRSRRRPRSCSPRPPATTAS